MSRKQMIEMLLKGAEPRVSADFCEAKYAINADFDILKCMKPETDSCHLQYEQNNAQEHSVPAERQDPFVQDLVNCGVSSRSAQYVKSLLDSLTQEQREALKRAVNGYM